MALATSSVDSFAALAMSRLDRLAVARRVRVAAATGHVVSAHFAFRDRGFEKGRDFNDSAVTTQKQESLSLAVGDL